MMLAIRTDKPMAELYVYKNDKEIKAVAWEAHRQLAATLHVKIDEILKSSNLKIEDIKKIGVFEGPGSFTGLRIGISAANALAYSLGVPIVQSTGESWLTDCIKNEGSLSLASPKYGRDPHITVPKK